MHPQSSKVAGLRDARPPQPQWAMAASVQLPGLLPSMVCCEGPIKTCLFNFILIFTPALMHPFP